jgi:hypothetical protein
MWHGYTAARSQRLLYAQLCKDLPGGKFIHHESLDLSDYAASVGHTEAVREFLDWIPRYVGRFGDFTEERAQYWRVCDFLRTEVGLSLDQINQLGRNALTPQESSA